MRADQSDGTLDEAGGLQIQDGGAAVAASSLSAENTGVVCFAKGTRIMTLRGDIQVENLRSGDLVVTRDNGLQPIVWIGRRRLDHNDLARRPELRPISISPPLSGGESQLIVSPQHGVLFTLDGEETLVRAIHLARLQGGAARIMQGCRSVTYFHILFESHQIVFSNGMPSESLFPCPFALAALAQDVRQEILTLFPDITRAEATQAYGPKARRFARFKQLPPRLRTLAATS